MYIQGVLVHLLVAEAVDEVNSSLNTGDSSILLQALHNKHAGLTNVQESNAPHYLTVLRAMRAAKVEVKYKFILCRYVHIYTCTCTIHNLWHIQVYTHALSYFVVQLQRNGVCSTRACSVRGSPVRLLDWKSLQPRLHSCTIVYITTVLKP